jgi:DNA repair photolyase
MMTIRSSLFSNLPNKIRTILLKFNTFSPILIKMDQKLKSASKVYISKLESVSAPSVAIGRGVSGLNNGLGNSPGNAENPAGRFERIQIVNDPELAPLPEGEERPLLRTQFFKDSSRTVLTTNDSPDVGFEASVNPYRGCEHGCIYCFARPTHEYLGLSAGLDFESKIFVKEDAAVLLREKLMSKSWTPKVVQVSGITDCYQPIERKLKITRSVLEVLHEFKNPFSIITKNHLVTRDLDLNGVVIYVSVTSLDSSLIERMEPRTSRPMLRLKAIETLAKANINVGAMIAPVIPGLTDHEMPDIIKAIANAGARSVSYVPLRLPYGLGELFEAWATQHFPDRKDKILNRIREFRGGKLNDPNFNSRMRGEGVFAEHLRAMFHLYTKKTGLNSHYTELSTEHFRRPAEHGQLEFF